MLFSITHELFSWLPATTHKTNKDVGRAVPPVPSAIMLPKTSLDHSVPIKFTCYFWSSTKNMAKKLDAIAGRCAKYSWLTLTAVAMKLQFWCFFFLWWWVFLFVFILSVVKQILKQPAANLAKYTLKEVSAPILLSPSHTLDKSYLKHVCWFQQYIFKTDIFHKTVALCKI